jgi:hypothetical protein
VYYKKVCVIYIKKNARNGAGALRQLTDFIRALNIVFNPNPHGLQDITNAGFVRQQKVEDDAPFFLIKDGTFFPLFCLTNPAQSCGYRVKTATAPPPAAQPCGWQGEGGCLLYNSVDFLNKNVSYA